VLRGENIFPDIETFKDLPELKGLDPQNCLVNLPANLVSMLLNFFSDLTL
jgi:hypothetical protein